MKRDWTEARDKVEAEGCCRACGATGELDAAHVIARSLSGARSMNADSVIPLCRSCHVAQHAHRLELLPMLSSEEQVEATRVVGLARAYRLTTLPEAA